MDFEGVGYVDCKGIKDCCEFCFVVSIGVLMKKFWNISEMFKLLFKFIWKWRNILFFIFMGDFKK